MNLQSVSIVKRASMNAACALLLILVLISSPPGADCWFQSDSKKHEPKPMVPSTVEITRLIQQLSSSNFQTREAAKKALTDLDDVAWDSLATADKDGQDVEARRRVQELLKRLEEKAAQGLRVLEGHKSRVESIAFSPDSSIVASAGAYDGTIRLWDVATGKELRQMVISSQNSYVSSVVFSPNGDYLLSAQWDKTVRLWNVKTGNEIQRFDGHDNLVYCAALSPDGQQALSGSLDKTIRLWHVASGMESRCLKGHRSQIWCVTFSADGKRALSGAADATARLWDLNTGEELRVFQGYRDVQRVAFVPDGKHCVTAGKDMRLWELETGKEVRKYVGHGSIIYGMALSKDGRWILSGGHDKTVRLWEIATGKQFLCYEKHTKGIRSVAISPNGALAASGSEDQTVRLWKLPAKVP